MAKQTNRIMMEMASTFVRGTSASALHRQYGNRFPNVAVELFGFYYDKTTDVVEATEDPTKRQERAERFARTFLNLIDSHQSAMLAQATCGYEAVKAKKSA